jgi:malonate transporter
MDVLALMAPFFGLAALGAVVARSQVLPGPTPRLAAPAVAGKAPSLSWLVGLKLLVHPALVWLLSALAAELDHDLPPLSVWALTPAAALPLAPNVSMLAKREGADAALVARVIVWTTGAAVGTLLLWSRLLGVQAVA